MNSKKIIAALLVVIFLILGVLTVVPNPAAHHISHLGYYSVCSFAPFSTATLFIFAAVFYAGFRKVAA
jgi:protein-S-isoprenylcysteine O-methyltransferase Ste14